MKNIKILLFTAALLMPLQSFCKSSKDKPNILFIVIDDLKTDLACYGQTGLVTPGIDQLAAQGVIFDNAYCQQAVCAPSRISCFTGMRPDRTQVVDLKTNMRDKQPDIVTIPQFFKQNGYETVGFGKLMHGAKGNDPLSWTIPYKEKDQLKYAKGYAYPANGKYQNPEAIKAYQEAKSKKLNWFETNAYLKERNLSPSVESRVVPDDAYPDGAVAEASMMQLEQFAKGDKPFFLAVGLNKPHLPFAAPKKYWDLYKRENIEVHPFQEKAKHSPDYAYHTWGELRNYSDIPDKGDLSIDKQKELIHGYRAATSFADAQVAKVMDKLKELQLDENTIVVLWGDHGWHLGDHGLWCKHSNFEQATKVPFIISAPGMAMGERAATMTEMVDIFPTLIEYAGFNVPKQLEGHSLLPVLEKPNKKVKDYAISQFPRGNNNMGYSMRTERYRLTLWLKGEFQKGSIVHKPSILGVELYDYKKDPLEKISLAGDPAYREITAELRNKLLTLLQEQAKQNKVNYSGKAQGEKTKKDSGKGLASMAIIDGHFSQELSKSWKTKGANGAVVDFKRVASDDGHTLKVAVSNLGKNPWDIQMMSKMPMQLKAGETFRLHIKGKGGEGRVVLHPEGGKQIVRHLNLSQEQSVQELNFPIQATGAYTLKLLFIEKGEYIIQEIDLGDKAKVAVPFVEGSVRLDNKNIHVLGANYVTRSSNELSFSRFSDKTYHSPNEVRMFSLANGRTNSGIKLLFKTASNKVSLKFVPAEGTNRGAEFLVLQDGQFDNTYKFNNSMSKGEMVLDLTNKFTGQSTVFEIVLPSLINLKLHQLIVDEGADLEVFTPDKKPVYLAIGNSITHGVGQGSASYLSYPYLLAEKLDYNYFNLAVGGAKISQAVAEQTSEMPQADLITILIGYNDLVGFGKTPEDYKKDYRKFLKTIRKHQPNATIYCISVTYTNTKKGKKTNYTPDDFRKSLNELVAEFSRDDNKIIFVEGDKISSKENLREDNPKDPVHFGIKGAALFADELYSIIAKDN
ncbi:sulfatase-like hydrolase/transferase [Carboxylicivirga marina]|uniref:Sulfatase-like hydrolase/transferase n=1 Tax=Carboxylicivirga marina TaxID=2800988 RepID=A0ABS1HNH5_9BACT|nr:sulfatase-like hydrolase/transferase [Carboxylicivirga marina]MBK3519237.1 sulfatase-like hydrolase/transferase [Carboxylicivirga marina]